MKNYRKNRFAARFTLVELLVVIAVIAILAALLMPALNSAIGKAQVIQCTSNLRNVNLGLIGYADAYDGFVPASGGGFSEITVPGGKRMPWAGQLVYEGLLPNGKVLTCPGIAKWNAYCWKYAYELTTQSARDFLDAGNGLLWQMGYGGYGLNCLVQGQPGFGRTYPRVRLGSVRQPSRKLLVADTRGKDIGGSPSANSSLEPAKMSGDAGGLNGGAAFGWHQETVNALFFDGHVKSVHGPKTTPQLFWIWTRSQPEFCFDNTQSADVSPWFMQ